MEDGGDGGRECHREWERVGGGRFINAEMGGEASSRAMNIGTTRLSAEMDLLCP